MKLGHFHPLGQCISLRVPRKGGGGAKWGRLPTPISPFVSLAFDSVMMKQGMEKGGGGRKQRKRKGRNGKLSCFTHNIKPGRRRRRRAANISPNLVLCRTYVQYVQYSTCILFLLYSIISPLYCGRMNVRGPPVVHKAQLVWLFGSIDSSDATSWLLVLYMQ